MNFKILTIHIFLCSVLMGCGSRYGKLPPAGTWVTVLAGDSVFKLAEKHQVPPEDIVEMNGLRDPSRILVGQKLFIPQLHRVLPISKNESTLTAAMKSPEKYSDLNDAHGLKALKGAPIKLMRSVQWPLVLSLKDKVGLSSPFGLRGNKKHKGIDISAPEGTAVKAALDGEVTRSDFSKGGYGWVIYIKHAGGVETRYAHHQKNLVQVGRFVHAGEMIAQVGNSGRSSGPHLHFELRVNGVAIDPLLILPAINSLALIETNTNLRPFLSTLRQ